MLLAAAQQLVPLDIALARETYLDTFTAALFGARLNRAVSVRDVSGAAKACQQRPDEAPTAAGVLLGAFCAVADGYETAVGQCRVALAVLSSQRESLSRESLRWLWHGTVLAFEVWDDTAAHYLSEAHVSTSRDTGALSELVLGLSSRTPVLVFRGELAAAASAVEEATWLEEATGVRGAPYGALLHDAWRGHQPQQTKDLIQATVEGATSRGEGIGITVSEYARALLCNSLGEYDQALLAAARATEDPTEWVAYNWALPELVEAATRADKPDVAAEALERLSRKARAAGTDWALGLEARSRALLGDGDETLYHTALDHLSRTSIRSELARTHLLLGEWLRRRKQRVAARTELSTAEQMFSAMGMDAFAVRARQELLATGATVRKRQVDTQGDLTAQEAHVARLARNGMSNPEIAAHLFISARTVEWHLRKVFLKLGISSRRQLHGVVTEHGTILLRPDATSIRPLN
jgi:DNA-binding CsgD family transcriptional regulator